MTCNMKMIWNRYSQILEKNSMDSFLSAPMTWSRWILLTFSGCAEIGTDLTAEHQPPSLLCKLAQAVSLSARAIRGMHWQEREKNYTNFRGTHTPCTSLSFCSDPLIEWTVILLKFTFTLIGTWQSPISVAQCVISHTAQTAWVENYNEKWFSWKPTSFMVSISAITSIYSSCHC